MVKVPHDFFKNKLTFTYLLRGVEKICVSASKYTWTSEGESGESVLSWEWNSVLGLAASGH